VQSLHKGLLRIYLLVFLSGV